MLKFIFKLGIAASIAIYLPAPRSAHAQTDLANQPQAVEGRRQMALLRDAARKGRISALDYYRRYYEIDRDYFMVPSAIEELNLYNIMMAKNLEMGRITKEEFDYYQNQKIQETVRKLVPPQQ